MSKINKTTLARGTKLSVEHAYGPIQDASTQMEQSTLDSENLQYTAPFRINWSIPYISGRWFSTAYQTLHGVDPAETSQDGKPVRSLVFPFTFFPFQELASQREETPFQLTGRNKVGQNTFILDELSFGFDTRAENRPLVDGYNQTNRAATDTEIYGQLGKREAEAQRQEITVSILSKPTYIFNAQDANPEKYKLNNTVVSFTIHGADFASPDFRLNPFTLTNINEALSPYETYALVIQVPFLDPRTKYPDDVITGTTGLAYYALHNVLCSMRVKSSLHTKLQNRSSGITEAIQNSPWYNDYSTPNPNPAPDVPLAGENINAEGTKGLQANIRKVDDELVKKYNGGMSRDSEQATLSPIKPVEATYEIIAVPLFGNKDDIRRQDVFAAQSGHPNTSVVNNPLSISQTDPIGGAVKEEYWESAGLPYVADFSAPDERTAVTMDSRLIPLSYPMEIHYVYAHQNGFSPAVDCPDGAVQTTDPNCLPPRSGFHRRVYNITAGGLVSFGDCPGVVMTDENMNTEIGVAVMNGIRGDGYTAQQIAYAKYNHSINDVGGVPSKNAFVFDRVQHIDSELYNWGVSPHLSAWGGNGEWQHELLMVPLVCDGSNAAVGTGPNTIDNITQPYGFPIFVGEGNSTTGGYLYDGPATEIPGRSMIGTDTPLQQLTGAASTLVVPKTKGGEQYLEVRWKISGNQIAPGIYNSLWSKTDDFVGEPLHPTIADPYTAESQEVLVGAGGHWVYIVGKKFLAGDTTGEGE